MPRILVKSVYDAFDYVMDHYAPAGLEELAKRKDSYAVISIQDTHTRGFGFVFSESASCRGVLTLYFDDVEREVPGAVRFTEAQAEAVLDFLAAQREADTLLIHCYGGESRSRAVGAFLTRISGGDDRPLLTEGKPNRHVFDLLETVWIRRSLGL